MQQHGWTMRTSILSETSQSQKDKHCMTPLHVVSKIAKRIASESTVNGGSQGSEEEELGIAKQWA